MSNIVADAERIYFAYNGTIASFYFNGTPAWILPNYFTNETNYPLLLISGDNLIYNDATNSGVGTLFSFYLNCPMNMNFFQHYLEATSSAVYPTIIVILNYAESKKGSYVEASAIIPKTFLVFLPESKYEIYINSSTIPVSLASPTGPTVYFSYEYMHLEYSLEETDYWWPFNYGNFSSLTAGPDGTVYFPGIWGTGMPPYPPMGLYLFAINPDGTLKWKFKIGDVSIYDFEDSLVAVKGIAVGSDNTVYVVCGSGLFAINPDGTLKWTSSLLGDSDHVIVGPTSMIYVGIAGFGYDPSQGTSYAARYLWIKYPNGTRVRDLILYNEYYSNGTYKSTFMDYLPDGSYLYYDFTNNKWTSSPYYITGKWNKASIVNTNKTYFPLRSFPAVGPDGTVYLWAGLDFYALYPDGTPKWVLRNLSGGLSSPVVDSKGIIYAPAFDGLYAINPDGTIKWKFKTDGSVFYPTIADGKIFFAVNGSMNIYAIGEPPSSAPLPSKPSVAVALVPRDYLLWFLLLASLCLLGTVLIGKGKILLGLSGYTIAAMMYYLILSPYISLEGLIKTGIDALKELHLPPEALPILAGVAVISLVLAWIRKR